jgi:hypothetical protein
MTAQYDDDQELKFKQTEPRSTMTELFVDLPMQASPQTIDPETTQMLIRRSRQKWSLPDRVYFAGKEWLSSAEFFIKAGSERELSRIVLEGYLGKVNRLSHSIFARLCACTC